MSDETEERLRQATADLVEATERDAVTYEVVIAYLWASQAVDLERLRAAPYQKEDGRE